MFKLESYLKILKPFQILRMDAEPFKGEDSIVLRLRASARKTKPSVKTTVVVCEITESIELVEQAYITPKKKKEEADKSQGNEHGQ